MIDKDIKQLFILLICITIIAIILAVVVDDTRVPEDDNPCHLTKHEIDNGYVCRDGKKMIHYYK